VQDDMRYQTDGGDGSKPSAGAVASEVAGTAKDQAGTVAHEVKSQAKSVASDVRDRVGEQARTQNDKLAGTMRRLADELDEMAGSRSDSPAGTVVSRIASGSRQAADYLAERGPDGLLSEVQEFARRRPAAFLATAAVAGFVVGRLGKAVWSGDSNGAQGTSANRVGTTSTGAGLYESGNAATGYGATTGSTSVPIVEEGVVATPAPAPAPVPVPAPPPTAGRGVSS
jgi:hypothetical protein